MFANTHCFDWLFARATALEGLSILCSYPLLITTFHFVYQLLIASKFFSLFVLSFIKISVRVAACSIHFMLVLFVILEKDNLDDLYC